MAAREDGRAGRRRAPAASISHGKCPAFARIAPACSSGASAAVTTPCAPVTVIDHVGGAQCLVALGNEEAVEIACSRFTGSRSTTDTIACALRKFAATPLPHAP